MKRIFIFLLVAFSAFAQSPIEWIVSVVAPKRSGPANQQVSTYTAQTATFAGDGQCWLERDGDLTGNSDGVKLSFSFWVNFSGGDGSQQYIYYSGSGYGGVSKQTDNTFRFIFTGTDGDSKIRIDQSAAKVPAIIAGSGWHWVAGSFDNSTNGSVAILYIDGVDATELGVYDQDGVNIDLTRTDHAIGSIIGGGYALQGCVSEIWISFAEYVDFSSLSVREKFCLNGKPVDLGSDGSTPTGNRPIIYLKNPYNSFTVNSGSGGNFVAKGTNSFSSCVSP